MVVRRRFSGRRTTRRRQRQLVWARASNLPAGTAVTTPVVAAADLLADFATQTGGGTQQGCTVMAIRGRIWIIGTSVQRSAFTAAIRVDDRVVLSLPAAELLNRRGPATTDRYGDWMFREYWWNSNAATQASQASYEYLPINVRSRRRLDEQQETLALYVEGQAGVASTFEFGFSLDTLLALP